MSVRVAGPVINTGRPGRYSSPKNEKENAKEILGYELPLELTISKAAKVLVALRFELPLEPSFLAYLSSICANIIYIQRYTSLARVWLRHYAQLFSGSLGSAY